MTSSSRRHVSCTADTDSCRIVRRCVTVARGESRPPTIANAPHLESCALINVNTNTGAQILQHACSRKTTQASGAKQQKRVIDYVKGRDLST